MIRTSIGLVVAAFLLAAAHRRTRLAALRMRRRPRRRSPAVNLNTASASQLEALPGIGAKMALRIVEYRQKNGGFKKIEDLMNVKGIGEKAFLKLKPHLTVSATKGLMVRGRPAVPVGSPAGTAPGARPCLATRWSTCS